MRKNTLIQNLAIGLSTLLLGLSSVQAADANVVQLIGPDKTVRSFQIDTAHVVQFGGRTQVRKASQAETKQLHTLKSTRGALTSTSGQHRLARAEGCRRPPLRSARWSHRHAEAGHVRG